MPGLIIGMVFIQFFLTFIYMPKVKRGEWGSNQNRSQFEKINWNSNIFMILFSARSDFLFQRLLFLINHYGDTEAGLLTKQKISHFTSQNVR